MKLLTEIHKNLLENELQSKIDWLRSKGVDVQEMPNGKLKIEHELDGIESLFVYDEPERAVNTAYSVAKSFFGE